MVAGPSEWNSFQLFSDSRDCTPDYQWAVSNLCGSHHCVEKELCPDTHPVSGSGCHHLAKCPIASKSGFFSPGNTLSKLQYWCSPRNHWSGTTQTEQAQAKDNICMKQKINKKT